MFTECHMIQFTLHCLITKTEDRSAQTAACTVSFCTERYQNTNFLIQSIISNSYYYPNTHRNISLP